MDFTKLFYWLVVADNARSLFITGVVIFTIISVIATICYLWCSHTDSAGRQTEDDKEDQKICRKWMWWSYPFMFSWWILLVFTPSKKDSLLIVAGGGTLNYLTTDSTAKQIPKELSNFVVTQLKSMAKENEVDLNIKEQKQKILDEAKDMSAKDLLEKMKTDSLFKKTILE